MVVTVELVVMLLALTWSQLSPSWWQATTSIILLIHIIWDPAFRNCQRYIFSVSFSSSLSLLLSLSSSWTEEPLGSNLLFKAVPNSQTSPPPSAGQCKFCALGAQSTNTFFTSTLRISKVEDNSLNKWSPPISTQRGIFWFKESSTGNQGGKVEGEVMGLLLIALLFFTLHKRLLFWSASRQRTKLDWSVDVRLGKFKVCYFVSGVTGQLLLPFKYRSVGREI